jgi:hypothetical protein
MLPVRHRVVILHSRLSEGGSGDSRGPGGRAGAEHTAMMSSVVPKRRSSFRCGRASLRASPEGRAGCFQRARLGGCQALVSACPCAHARHRWVCGDDTTKAFRRVLSLDVKTISFDAVSPLARESRCGLRRLSCSITYGGKVAAGQAGRQSRTGTGTLLSTSRVA